MGGLLQISTPQSAMGAVSLATNAMIEAIEGISVHFADSSSLPWDTNSTLVIQSWGWGGPQHIYFGTNSAGLTPAQLARVRFGTPHWLPEGNYPARILSTGEIVPAPIMASERSGSQLKIYWSDDAYRLLSSTNIQGPYSPVAGATSPYTEDMTGASQGFFIIQSQ
jgi:hypothetical protein